MYEIKANDLTILLNNPNSEGKFEFEGLILNRQPDTVYRRYIPYIDEGYEGKKIISISNYLFDKMKAAADEQLEKYIQDNINNMDFYTEKGESGNYIFWGRYNINFIDKYPKIEDSRSRIGLNDIVEGIASCSINRSICEYDFIQDKITITKYEYGDNREMTPLEVFYGGSLNHIVAVEQYRKGTAHPAFTEIVNLNKFLEGKKSVKIILKDGQVIEYKNAYGIYSGDILELYPSGFYIDDNYRMSPRINKHLPISELDYLQFGKNIYRINTDNLNIE